MNELLGQSLLEKNLVLKPEILLGTLILCFILGLIISWCYRKTHSGISYSRSLPFTMMVIPVIIGTILMAIGSSIALSLGLVGSLSILRFRTAVRDTRDMVFIFAAVSAGLSCGSGNYVLAVIGTLFFGMITFCAHRLQWFSQLDSDYLLTVVDRQPTWQLQSLKILLNENCLTWELKSVIDEKDQRECHFAFVLKKGISPSDFIDTLRQQTSEGATLRMIAPDNSILF